MKSFRLATILVALFLSRSLNAIGCFTHSVKDVVFVIDTSGSIGFTRFQLVRELAENITINLKRNSPETLFGLITFDDIARFEFNISKHTNLSTLLPAINPGLPFYGGYGTNTTSALSLLLSGSVEGGFLQLRNKPLKVAIVITDGVSSNSSSLQSAANSLHAANIFDVYAVGIGYNSNTELQLIASDPSFVFSTRFLATDSAQRLERNVIEKLCSANMPKTFLNLSHVQQATIGESLDLVCSVAISSIAEANSVNLTWNFTSNDNRVTVIPATITTDDSIGMMYTTVIQFAYLMEGDEGNYTCNLTDEGYSTESTFNLKIINPIVNMKITATNNPTIYQPLILQCVATIVRGITSTVDIIWTTGDTQVRRVNNVTASGNINSTSVYSDSFTTPPLNISDIGSVYQCEVLINSFLSTTTKTEFVIPIPGSRCSGNLAQDVIFVIDTSGSIGLSNFQLIKEFTANITTELIHNSLQNAVGIILFNDSPHVQFKLQAYNSLIPLLSAIDQLPYSGNGRTDTAEALTLLLSTAQNETLGLRNSSSKVAIVITDGHSNSQSATISAAAALHASNIFDVYAVGVGGADLTELKTIASSPEFVYSTSLFNNAGLQQLVVKILRQLCNGAFPNIFLQPSGSDQNTIGQRQDVICSISVPPDVDPDEVKLGWVYEDDIITNDSRVTIDNNFNNSTLVTIIQFNSLIEEDEDEEYICYAIINGSLIIESIYLENFTTPSPLVQIAVLNNETLGNITLKNVTIGDPLTLDCTVTAVRGISSTVDIIWTAGPGDEVMSKVYNITADIGDDNAIYTDSFEISSLSAIDNGREYQCTVVINASQPVNSSDQIILNFPAPVCFNSLMTCEGESVDNNSLSFDQCCFASSGVSFASFGRCLQCPKYCSRRIVRDVIFVIDTSRDSYHGSRFGRIKELTEKIIINLKVNSPETLFGLITFDSVARFEFDILNHTTLSTLLPAINYGLPFYNRVSKNIPGALSLLLSGSVEGNVLKLRDETSKVAIVITFGHTYSSSLLRSAANSLHAANIFDVYALGVGDNVVGQLQAIASDPKFIFNAARFVEENIIEQLCSTPTPRTFLKPSYLQQGIIGKAHNLVCSIAISFTAETSSVNLTWNVTSNDNRVTVIPSTITTDDSIGIIYTTVIQFAYLMEGDEGNYTCILTLEGSSSESTFNLKIIDPIVTVDITAANNPTIYQPLILQCNATIVRGITSTVDIIWTTGDTQVRRVNNVTASSNINSISVYNDSFIIPSLNISDIGSVYQCEVLVNSTADKADFIIPLPGSKCSDDSVKDVLFIIDGSYSVSSSHFQLFKELTTNITTEIIHSSPRSAVGVILFDSFVYFTINLQTHNNLSVLLSNINQLRQFAGGKDTADALKFLSSTAQNEALGLRSDTVKVAIILTNGASSSSTLPTAAALHALNIFDVYVIGGDSTNITQLESIASNPKFVYHIPEFDYRTSSLNSVAQQQLQTNILHQLCNGSFLNIYLQSSGVGQNTVGQQQDVICSISLPPNVDPDIVKLGWVYENDIVTDDSRVTINTSNDYFNVSKLVSIIHFNSLIEEDEGEYICYAIINGSFVFEYTNLQNFTTPAPLVQITVFGYEMLQNDTLRNLTIGDPLILDCTVTAVRGISSSVDIIWTAGPGYEVISRVYNITANVENDSAIYTNLFTISSLSAIDNGREYQCTVVINASQPVNGSDQITLFFPAPVCFSTTYCGGQSVSNESLSFHQCCSGLSGVSFVSHGQCLLCPKDCSKRVVRDVVFVIDISHDRAIMSWFESIRQFMERIIVNLKANSPETLFGLITFDRVARLEFNISNHTDLSTILTAIKLEIPYYSYYIPYATNTTSALRLLLSGSVEGGFLDLRESTSKVAIVVTDGSSSSPSSLQSAANSLHAANIFDVYAVGIGTGFGSSYYLNGILRTTASDPSFVFSSNYLNSQPLVEDVIEVMCSHPTPRVFIKPNYLRQGIIGQAHELVCLIALSSTEQTTLVDLAWNFTSNDSRVTVIPTTITTDDSIGIIYTTVIQFAYLMEGDEGNYTCTIKIEGDLTESTFILELINPIVTNEVTATNNPTIYQPLILQCNATIVRGITSAVDIIWTIGDTQVKRVNNVTASSNINSISVYNHSFIIPLLDISDIGSVYQCEVLFKSILPITAKRNFSIPIPGSKCSGNPYLDVVFVIDASDGPYFFERLQEFTANLTAELIPTSPRISIGVILYQDDAAIQFNLQAYDNLNALLSAIDQLTYNGGRTDTAKALRLLLSTAQNGELGLRNSSAKVAIVLTDGYSYYPSETSSAVAALHASNIFDVYAIGLYGSSLYRLQGIASSPEFVFLLYSLGNTVLQQLQDRLLPQLCKACLMSTSAQVIYKWLHRT